MGFAKNVSDKIVFMADGVVEEIGAPQDVIENPKSEKLKTFLSSVTNKDGE
jgi:polar amino acid transport system ATP-binding protein